MAVIDSLVIELGLDPAKFTQGQRDAMGSLRKFQEQAVAGGKEIESQQKKSENFFSTLKRQALVFTGLMMGGKGFKEFILGIASADAQTGRFAHTLGSTVENLSRWQGVAEQFGGTAATVSATLLGLRNSMELYLGGAGGGEFVPLLEVFDVKWVDANKKIRDSAEIILDLVEAMKAKGVEPPRMAAYMRQFLPGMNEQSINMFIQGRKAVDDARVAIELLGGATDKSAKDAQRLEAAWAQLKRSADELGRTVGTGLFPVMSTLLDIFTALFSGNIDLSGEKAEKLKPPEQRQRPTTLGEMTRTALGVPETPHPPPPPPRPGEGPVLRTFGNTQATPAKEPPGLLWGERPPQEPQRPARALQEPPRPPAAPQEPPKPGAVPTPPVAPQQTATALRSPVPAQEPPKPPPTGQEPPRPAPLPPPAPPQPTALRSPVRPPQPQQEPPGAVPYLNAKPGAFSGRESPGVMALAARIQAMEPGLNRFTAGNDRYHSSFPSPHNRGLALDFTVKNPAEAAAIAERLQKELGRTATVSNEYDKRRQTPFTTAPHIHVQFNSAAAAERYATGGMRPGAARAFVPAGAAAAGTTDSSRTTTVTNTTNIQAVNIQTQATDAEGIAGSMEQWLKRMSVAAPADSGQR